MRGGFFTRNETDVQSFTFSAPGNFYDARWKKHLHTTSQFPTCAARHTSRGEIFFVQYEPIIYFPNFIMAVKKKKAAKKSTKKKVAKKKVAKKFATKKKKKR